jgi:hypothetical protein
MAKAKQTQSSGVTLPGGTLLTLGDKVNFRTTTGLRKDGIITDFRPGVGDHGWMCVQHRVSGDYEWLSIKLQLEHIGEAGILVAKKKQEAA